NLGPALNQLVLQLGSTHARHAHIEDQAFGFAEGLRVEKAFRGRKHFHRMAQRLEQALQRFAERLVIIDYGDVGSVCHWNTLCSKILVSSGQTIIPWSHGRAPLDPAAPAHPPRSIFSAMRTRSASDSAFIFRITRPRCVFTVISLVPKSAATCL